MPEMTASFLEFEKLMTFYVQAVALTGTRFWGVFFIFPLFVWAGVPPIVTSMWAFAFALPALPAMVSVLAETNLMVWPISANSMDAAKLLSAIERYQVTIINLKEFMLGVMLGFFPASFFYGFIIAGELIDQARGDIGGRSAGGGNLQMTNCGQIFFLAGSILFLASGEFLHFIKLIYRSYEVWPLFELSGFLTAGKLFYFLELSIMMLYSMVKVGVPFLIVMWSFDIQSLYQVKTDKKFQAQEYQHALKNFIFIFFFIYYLQLTDNEQYSPTLAIASNFAVILEAGGSGH